jgi:hypothetical protein
MKLIILGNFMGYVNVAIVVVAALVGFILGWSASDFLIPPRDYWTKSGLAMLGTKFGIALGGAYFAVVGAAYLFGKILS